MGFSRLGRSLFWGYRFIERREGLRIQFQYQDLLSHLSSSWSSAGLRQGVFTHSALGIMVVTIPSLEEEAEAGDVGYGELTVGGRAYTGFGVVRRRIVRFLPSFSLAWCCVYIDITARF